MIGNLSKTIIKAPHYFNFLQTDSMELSKVPEDNILDTFNTTKKKNSKINAQRYFKEGDFFKKNLKLDINYNHNRRTEASPKVRTYPVKCFEEIMFGTKNPRDSLLNNSNTGNKMRISRRYENTPMKTTNKINSQEECCRISQISKESDDNFHYTLKTNVDALIDRINKSNVLGLSKYNLSEQKKLRINTNMDYINDIFGEERIIEPPMKYKLPRVNRLRKSQEILFKESMEKKLNSLTSIGPAAKEQIERRNLFRNSLGDSYRINKSYDSNEMKMFY